MFGFLNPKFLRAKNEKGGGVKKINLATGRPAPLPARRPLRRGLPSAGRRVSGAQRNAPRAAQRSVVG